MSADIAELIVRARQGDPEAVDEIVEHFAAIVMRPRRRGGEPQWRTKLRAERDAALRQIAATIPGNSLRAKAEKVRSLIDRYAVSGWHHEQHIQSPGDSVRDLMRRVLQTRLRVPARSRLIKILQSGQG